LIVYYRYAKVLFSSGIPAIFWTLRVHDKAVFSMGLKRLFSGLFRIKQAVLSFILRLPVSCLINVGHRRVFFTFLNIAEQQE